MLVRFGGKLCAQAMRKVCPAMPHNDEQVFAMAGATEFRPPKQMPIEKLKYKLCLKAK